VYDLIINIYNVSLSGYIDLTCELCVLVFCRHLIDGSTSTVAVHRVVYVDQHGKVLAQHTTPAVR